MEPRQLDAPEVVDPTLTATRTAVTLPVIVFRCTVPAVFYLLFFGINGPAPAPFSRGSWAIMLLPPAATAVALFLGLRLRVQQPTRRRWWLSRASAAVAVFGLVVACAFSLLWLLGELYDYAIPVD